MRTNKVITWDCVRDQILSNPKVKVEYEALKQEFKIARKSINSKEKNNLRKLKASKIQLY